MKPVFRRRLKERYIHGGEVRRTHARAHLVAFNYWRNVPEHSRD